MILLNSNLNETNSNLDKLNKNDSTNSNQNLGYNTYITGGQMFECPCDGYVNMYIAKGAPRRTIYVYSPNNKLLIHDWSLIPSSTLDQVSTPIFVKKGMRVCLDSANANSTYSQYTRLMWTPLDN